MNKLVFYGPTGKGLPDGKVGGGERGCQRTIALYEKLGVKVIPIEKPNLGRGRWAFLYYSFITPFLLISVLVKNRRAPVHIVGFYENQLFYEYMIFLISKMFGRKTIYELRNGTMVRNFDHHSWLYRNAMQAIIEKSSVVLCQGMDFVIFIQQNWKANTIYYPNYIMSSFIHPYYEQRAN